MASLKDMRNRIGSVKATQKITKAMQMVAAAKLRRSQDAAQNARPYAERMAAVIANLAAGVSGDGAPRLLAGTGSDQQQLVVVAVADRGLAGGFTPRSSGRARDTSTSSWTRARTSRSSRVGKKSRDPLRRMFGERLTTSTTCRQAQPALSVAQPIADRILEMFENGQADVVTLFFSRFKSVVSQTADRQQLIPAQVADGKAAGPERRGL